VVSIASDDRDQDFPDALSRWNEAVARLTETNIRALRAYPRLPPKFSISNKSVRGSNDYPHCPRCFAGTN
jgi:hypothetical protein